jgi:ABC-type transporter Mla MlaB component
VAATDEGSAHDARARSLDGPTGVMRLDVTAPIRPEDVPGLCARACRQLDATDAPRILCDVAAFAEPDAAVVDALARLQLAAKRLGRSIELRGASTQLQELLTLMGLAGVMSFAPDEP